MAICAGWCRESGHLARRQGHPSVVVLHARRKSYFRQAAKRVHYVRDRIDSRKWFRIKFQHGDPTRARRQQSACASASRAGTVRGQSCAARIERPRAQYYREHDRRLRRRGRGLALYLSQPESLRTPASSAAIAGRTCRPEYVARLSRIGRQCGGSQATKCRHSVACGLLHMSAFFCKQIIAVAFDSAQTSRANKNNMNQAQQD